MVFRNKRDLLQLYNAINGSNYTNEDDLMVNTLEDAFLIGVKNDLSFILSLTLNLYEQQSSWNANIPLRGLIYFAETYSAYIQQHKLHLYGSKLIKLPLPQYIVFYNGTADQPDRVEMKLSDAFEVTEKEGCLECKATMININYGHNKELLNSCEKLKEYAQFVDIVRSHLGKGNVTEGAIVNAMNECIEAGILVDILEKNRGEIMNILGKEYYEKYYWKLEKKAVREETIEEVREEVRGEVREEMRGEVREEVRGEVRGEVREEIRKEMREEGIGAMILDNLEEGIPAERILEKLKKRYLLDENQALKYIDKYLIKD